MERILGLGAGLTGPAAGQLRERQQRALAEARDAADTRGVELPRDIIHAIVDAYLRSMIEQGGRRA